MLPYLLTAAQMAEADRRTIAAGTPGLVLMQRAGRAVFDTIETHYPAASYPSVRVLAGPGNNGGDGYIVARLLKEAGRDVRLCALNGEKPAHGDAAEAAAGWDGAVEPLCAGGLTPQTLVVDALFGTGLQRPVEGEPAACIQAVRDAACPVVAVDLPSGICSDSGAALDTAMRADLTVTFAARKRGQFLLPGRHHSGVLIVADIGIPPELTDALAEPVFANEPPLWRDALPRRTPQSHKYTHGHAAIIGGDTATGAARLAARAALRGGAGLVSVICSARAFAIYATALEAVMVKPQRDDLAPLLEDARIGAWLIGPGAGTGADTATREQALAILRAGRTAVLDADALSVFADEPQILFDAIRTPTILTPHEGEFERLFEHTGLNRQADRLTRARQAAEMAGAYVVLKGADTVIAAPDGRRAAINAHAPPTLATAGSGDVLAGFITGLCAQGMEAFAAACAAVWLHGEAARLFGEGLIAEDLPDLLPQARQAASGATVISS